MAAKDISISGVDVASSIKNDIAATASAPDFFNYVQNAISIKTAERRKRRRAEAIEFFGSKCCKCGFSDARALQFDHINGGGSKHLREFGQRSNYYLFIIENKKDFQLLCANCNWIKRVENNELAHHGKTLSIKTKRHWEEIRMGIRKKHSAQKKIFTRLPKEKRLKPIRARYPILKKHRERIEKIRARLLLPSRWQRGDPIIPVVSISEFNSINKTNLKDFSELVI